MAHLCKVQRELGDFSGWVPFQVVVQGTDLLLTRITQGACSSVALGKSWPNCDQCLFIPPNVYTHSRLTVTPSGTGFQVTAGKRESADACASFVLKCFG